MTYALMVMWFLCPLALGAPQDLSAVRAVARAFVQARMPDAMGEVHIHVSAPQVPLELSACEQMNAFAPPGTRYWGAASVGVRCESPRPWTLYLPVRIQVLGKAAVSARALAKGDTVDAADVQIQVVDLTQVPRGSIAAPEDIVGLVAKGPIAGGSVLHLNLFRAPPLVLQGEAVRIAFAGDGFEISTAGRALTTGGLGEFVNIKAVSGRVLRATVMSKGVVLVR